MLFAFEKSILIKNNLILSYSNSFVYVAFPLRYVTVSVTVNFYVIVSVNENRINNGACNGNGDVT